MVKIDLDAQVQVQVIAGLLGVSTSMVYGEAKQGYRLLKAYTYILEVASAGGRVEKYTLIIPKGYFWDGATYAVDTFTVMRASCVHDALYELLKEHKYSEFLTRKLADLYYYKICKEDGEHWFRALYMYYAIRLRGGSRVR